MATDRFANYAELSAVFVEGTDYRIDLAKKGSKIGITAYHGGGIEIGTTELMTSITDKRTSWSWYGFEALLASDNRDLHITSVNYDEPRGVDWLTTVQRAVSLHGAEGDTPLTYIGGLDMVMRNFIQARLEAKGFVVAESPPEIAGMQPENFVNRPPMGGVQLELTTQMRKNLFLNGDWSRSARTNKANWTQVMHDYTDAIIEGVELALAMKAIGRGQLTLTDMNDVVASATAPVSPTEGALWFNETDKKLYVYVNGGWSITADYEEYVKSRGENLVTNGTGLLGNNKNFSGFTFDSAEVFAGGGSFFTASQNTSKFSDELIPVDTTRRYRFSLMAKSKTGGGKAYFGVTSYDIDGNIIVPYNFYGSQYPIVELAQDLKVGDTVIKLSAMDGFVDTYAVETHNHSIAFWGYKNQKGYTYPDGTYTRTYASAMWNQGSFDTVTKTITLNKPWSLTNPNDPEGIFRVGQKVSRTASGGNYQYMTASNVNIPTTWTKFSGVITGNGVANNKFPYGTSFVKLLFLLNRDTSGGLTGDNTWLNSLSFSDVTDTEEIGETITDIQETLGNMANDNIIDFQERQVVKDKLTDIIGYVIADTATTLPTTATLDAGLKGSFYMYRKRALSAGLSTTEAKYIDVATKYNALKSYLEARTPIDTWDVSVTNKDTVITVVKADFRKAWLDYYLALEDLAEATTAKLKENVDNVTVGATNYASNGNFEYDITKSLWNGQYVGQTKEVVDISTEAPPFKYALHIKNTTSATGGISSPTLWSGVSAQNLVNKEITISFWMKYQNITQGTNVWNAGRFGELIIEGETSTGTKVNRYPRVSTTNTSVEGSAYFTGTNMTWVKYSATHKLTLPTTAVKLTNIQFRHALDNAIGEFWVTGLKIEIGNKVTDWSQAPMDVNARMSDVEFKVTKEQIYSSLTQVDAFNATMNAKQDATEFNFEKGMANWYADHGLGTPLTNSGGISIISGVGIDGTNVLQVTSPSKFIFYGKKFPVLPNHIYQVTFRVRQTVDGTAGTNKVYAGVGAYDVNRAPLTTSTLGSHRYCAVSAKETVSADGWQTYVGTITGEGNEDVGQFIPNTRYATPMFIVNYSNGTGTAQIDYCGFEDITALDSLAQQVNSVVQTMTPEGISTVITETTAYSTLKNDIDSKAKSEDLGTLANEVDQDLKDVQDAVDAIASNIEALDIPNTYQTKQEASDTATAMTKKFSASGGMNLLRNSIGFADFITESQAVNNGTKNWFVQGITTRVESIHTTDLDTLGFGSGFYFSPSVAGQNTSINQYVTVVPNETYTLSWYLRKDNVSSTANTDGQFRIIIYEANNDTFTETYASDYTTSGKFEAKNMTFTPVTDRLHVRIYAHGLTEATITGLMFTIGDVALQWSLATGETYNTTTRIDINGVRVSRYEYDANTDKNIERGYVQITPSEFAGYWDSDGDRNFEKVFYLNGDETVSKKVVAMEEFTMGTVKIIRVPNDPIWKPSTYYNATDTVSVGRNVYTCTTAGVTGGAKPTHTSGTATDGTVVWTFKYTSANIGWAFTPIE